MNGKEEILLREEWCLSFLQNKSEATAASSGPIPEEKKDTVIIDLVHTLFSPQAPSKLKEIYDGLVNKACSNDPPLILHSAAVCSFGLWLMQDFNGGELGRRASDIMKETKSHRALQYHAKIEDWTLFTRDIWLAASMLHDTLLPMEREIKKWRHLAREFNVVGHLYKNKIRKSHIWRTLRGSIFMRFIGKELVMESIKPHAENNHAALCSLQLLMAEVDNLKSPEGFYAQMCAIPIFMHHRKAPQFDRDPLSCLLAFSENVVEMAQGKGGKNMGKIDLYLKSDRKKLHFVLQPASNRKIDVYGLRRKKDEIFQLMERNHDVLDFDIEILS